METTTTWLRTATGYSLSGSRPATIEKRGNRWILCAAGREFDLPRRPTFDHAEQILTRINISA